MIALGKVGVHYVEVVTMEQFEKDLCERNDDDWFVPDYSMDYIAETEYKIYMRECADVYNDDGE